jgi:peptidoglycan/LPS O-acetylase OafA/YrhL
MRYSGRLESLQYMRGVAALAVAIGHLTWPLTHLPTLSNFIGSENAKLAFDMAAGTWLPRVYEWMPSSQYFVQCFFVLSGFVIQLSLRSTNAIGFLIQRGFRLYPTLWVTSLVAILGFLVADKPIPDFDAIASEMLLVDRYELNPAVWTLLIEMRFYLAAALFFAFGCGIRLKTIILCAALSFLAVASFILPPSFFMEVFRSIFFYLVWMHCGSLVYEIWVATGRRERERAVRLFAGHLLAFVACYIVLHKAGFFGNKDASLNPGTLSAALLTLILLVFGERYLARRSRLLEYLGNISYPLYLLHIPLGWLVFSLIFRDVGPTAGVLIGFGAVMLAATLIHNYVEWPLNLAGKQIAKRASVFRMRAPKAMAPADSPG